jgi:hypothetical protein
MLGAIRHGKLEELPGDKEGYLLRVGSKRRKEKI